MANVETRTPRSPSVQSFASADTVSIAFTSTPGSPVMSPTSDDAAARATHEATDVPAQSHRFYLDVRSLKLKLDDGTFYHVHRHFFERHAPRFAEQHLCGETPDIIEVHDISSVDFQRFLSIIYPSDLGVCDIHTVDEWTSVLRLATKWSVTSLRDVAVREIETLRPTPIDTIVIEREFGLGEAWLVPAFVALCKSSEPLGFEDAERLGLRTAIEIARIRELYLRSGESYDVEAAARASNVLLSPGANGVGPRRASVSSLTPPPDSAPVPTGLAAPILSNEPGFASVFDPYRSSSPQSPLPRLDDDLAYLALLSAERAEERLFTGGCHGYHGHYFALRIAHRLVTEKSNAAIRHRYWRRMWLKLGGYDEDHSSQQEVSLNTHSGRDALLQPLCSSIAKSIVARLDPVTQHPLEYGQSRDNVLTVQVQGTHTFSNYPVATGVEDIKKLLDREGFSWSQDADDATCIRVDIPLPSRDWFVDGP